MLPEEFFVAARQGDIDKMRQLLQTEGFDVNFKNEYGYSVLMAAADNGHAEVVRLLLEREEIDVNEDQYGVSALILAANKGHTEVVRLLLEREEIDVNVKNQYGTSVLIIAAQNDHTEVVRLLLGREEIDINFKNQRGVSALSLAAYKGHTEIVKLLLLAVLTVKLTSLNDEEYLRIDGELLTTLQKYQASLTEEGIQACQYLVNHRLKQTPNPNKVRITGIHKQNDAGLLDAAALLLDNTSVIKAQVSLDTSDRYWIGDSREESTRLHKVLDKNRRFIHNLSFVLQGALAGAAREAPAPAPAEERAQALALALAQVPEFPLGILERMFSQILNSDSSIVDAIRSLINEDIFTLDRIFTFPIAECTAPNNVISQLDSISPTINAVSVFFPRAPIEGEVKKLADALPGTVRILHIRAEDKDIANEWQRQLNEVMPQLRVACEEVSFQPPPSPLYKRKLSSI